MSSIKEIKSSKSNCMAKANENVNYLKCFFKAT